MTLVNRDAVVASFHEAFAAGVDFGFRSGVRRGVEAVARWLETPEATGDLAHDMAELRRRTALAAEIRRQPLSVELHAHTVQHGGREQ